MKNFTFKRITATEAAEKMEIWKNDSQKYIEEMLDEEAKQLREALLESFDKIYSPNKYKVDLNFGFELYRILKEFGFTIYDAADDGIWRYLSLCVVPDIVAKRWGKTAESRYYKTSNRIYLKSIWRYIFLSWQGTYEDTYKVLEYNTTDQILNLVDRVGKKGYNFKLYRTIMKLFYNAKMKNKSVGDMDFRKVMVLHTTLCTTIEPDFYSGGIEGYAKMLFDEYDIKV